MAFYLWSSVLLAMPSIPELELAVVLLETLTIVR